MNVTTNKRALLRFRCVLGFPGGPVFRLPVYWEGFISFKFCRTVKQSNNFKSKQVTSNQ